MKAVISAATKGIGKAIAEKFIAEGFDLAICARTLSDLEALKATFKEKYPYREVIIAQTDMSKPEAIQDFANLILHKWEKIDVLINNAGVFHPGALTDANSSEGFVQMMDTNLYSAYYLTQALLPKMQAKKSGHIMNICSIASFMPYGAYSVSKYALLGYSKVLREELKEDNIRVTAIMPGATRTASWDGTDLPEERFMPAEDIAQSVWACYELSKRTVVEEIVLRPQLGDI